MDKQQREREGNWNISF